MKRMEECVPSIGKYTLQPHSFVRGDALVRYQEPLCKLSFMVEGHAKVFRVMENGRSVLYSLLSEGEVIGDLEFLLGYPKATSDIRATSDGWLLTIPLSVCRDQVLSDAPMLRFLGRELARKLARSSSVGAQNMLYPLSIRLSAYILFSAQDGFFLENLVQVSEVLAVSYRHLLRILSLYCQRGYLQREKQGYRILNEDALQQEGRSVLREE